MEALTRPLGKLGRATAEALSGMGYAAMLLYESIYLSAVGWRIGQPLRLRSVLEQMRQIGVDALPIVCLLAFTVGIMLGIQFVSALGEFGAQSQVVIAVAKSVTREFGALITAILVAGRSGSALAARIGSMTVSQEVDALAVIGIDPVRYLVAPALIAMLIMLPLLTVFADAVAIYGAALYSAPALDITPSAYMLQTMSLLVPGRSRPGHRQERGVRAADHPDRRQYRLLGYRRRRGRRSRDDARGGPFDLLDHRRRHDLFVLPQPMSTSPPTDRSRKARSLVRQAAHPQWVDFTVHPGEIRVIMGGSGSGKSTLLRHMLGLNRPVAGTVKLFGTDLADASDREKLDVRKRIGVSFQGGALLTSMTVGDNVALPLREHTDLDEQTIRIMSRIKLEVVNLGGFQDLMPSQLSGGMIKRAALARAIVMDPRLLFFDEPSAGLDPVVSAELDELILRLRDALRMTIVVVTHELESAFKIADTITVLDQGNVLMTGTTAEVRAADNDRIQDLLNRRPREVQVDADEYLLRLVGGDA